MYKRAIEKNPELINIGKKWSQEEEKLLLERIKEGKSHNDISIEFKRTRGGISSHIKDLAIKYYNDDEPIEIIQHITRLSKDIIMEAVEHQKNKKLNKKERSKKENSKKECKIVDDIETKINEITISKPITHYMLNAEQNFPKEKSLQRLPLLNAEQQAVLDEVNDGKNVFVTGPGGVGKSFLIREIKRQLESKGKKVAITSLTGMAALLIGSDARTVHSWSGVGIGNRSVDDMFSFIRKCQPKVREAWRTTHTLIIDEISMMSDEIFEKLDQLGRKLRWKEDTPFGGLQIISLGDFFQLPPINTKFVFESVLWEESIHSIVFLDTIYRQKDPVFQKILNEIRIGEVSDETDTILKTRLNLDFSKEEIQPTKIFTRRDMVESVNKECLEKLSGEVYTYKLTTKGKANTDAIKNAIKKMDSNAQYVDELKLKIGAQVMLITNLDQESGLVNGKVGIVKECKSNMVLVTFKGDTHDTEIKYNEWQVDDYENIHRCQIPLILAYAITTHKSQGATLESAYIDIGKSVFEYGQAYVALSRVKNLNALYLHDYDRKAIRAHPKVLEYYKSLE
uniref:AAA+ ATPase domain-containing protein n=1 Tax=viral metagenome TaxID=1070528 RepID=A0A6C0D5I4_9ZZZZ